MAADFSVDAFFSSSSDITTKFSRSTSKPRTISSAGTSLPVASEMGSENRMDRWL
jgi:hypothetical protein